MTLPNYITIARILMIPFFVLLVVYYKHDEPLLVEAPWLLPAAFFVYVIACLTDGLDGYIARKYNQGSPLGRVLDPVADKTLELAGLLATSLPGPAHSPMPHFPLWFLVLFFSREFLIALGYGIIHHFNRHVHVNPHWTGKTASALLMVSISYLLYGFDLVDFRYLLVLTSFFMVTSLLFHLRDGLRQLRDKGHGLAGS